MRGVVDCALDIRLVHEALVIFVGILLLGGVTHTGVSGERNFGPGVNVLLLASASVRVLYEYIVSKSLSLKCHTGGSMSSEAGTHELMIKHALG